MTSETPSWELYRSFLAVLREGSLSGAARALELTQPTIGRHIDALETALDAALFTRAQNGLSPTEAARDLEPYAAAMETASLALLRAAASSRDAIRGTVRVTASEIIGGEVLPPIIADLQREHPDLVIELALSNRTEDLVRRDADIAVRMVRPQQQALVARRIGDITLGFHARRDYLERRGTPATFDDLKRHALIGFDVETPAIRAMRGNREYDRSMFSLRTDSDLAQLAAIRAGCGVGVCQVELARRTPDVMRVMADQFELKLETWVAMHEDLRASPRCRATFDALADGLARYIAQASR